jgi:hypothetical protein
MTLHRQDRLELSERRVTQGCPEVDELRERVGTAEQTADFSDAVAWPSYSDVSRQNCPLDFAAGERSSLNGKYSSYCSSLALPKGFRASLCELLRGQFDEFADSAFGWPFEPSFKIVTHGRRLCGIDQGWTLQSSQGCFLSIGSLDGSKTFVEAEPGKTSSLPDELATVLCGLDAGDEQGSLLCLPRFAIFRKTSRFGCPVFFFSDRVYVGKPGIGTADPASQFSNFIESFDRVHTAPSPTRRFVVNRRSVMSNEQNVPPLDEQNGRSRATRKSPRAAVHARKTATAKVVSRRMGLATNGAAAGQFLRTPLLGNSDRTAQAEVSDTRVSIDVPVARKVSDVERQKRSSGAGGSFGFPEESLQRERALIESAKLSKSVESWFDLYSQVGGRPVYSWKWCVHGAEVTTIPAVLPEWRRHVCDTKVLSIMLCVLLDDVADEQGNEQLLEALMEIVERQRMPAMGDFSEKERKCAEVTLELSTIYEGRVAEYPLCDVYRRLLRFDLMQYFNTMRYSCLLNENLNLLNVTEHELYLPHAMHMMSFSTLDLMCTPDFDVHELGRYREVIWHAQCMGRVGNLLSTWEREIGQTDFTSGVFARAVVEGDLRVDQLRVGEAPAIEAAIVDGGHEQHFLNTWYEHRERLKAKVAQIHSIDLQDFVERQERFFQMHLACRGTI